MLKGKHILLGVTGSIAAYKSAVLVRNLVKQGAEVKVVMTEMAKQFITPLTMATLSKNPILVDFYNPENGDWNSHVSLGMWADLYLIAPCSANTIGKMVSGVADNLLLTSYLSAKCKVAVAPAMDLDMYKHQSTQRNLETLKSWGVEIIEPESGELASGLEGKGRMAEPEDIVLQVESIFAREGSMKGKKVNEHDSKRWEKLQTNLQDTIRCSMRRGDSAARCSASQYVIMLPRANYENSCMVCERIIKAYYQKYSRLDAELRYEVFPIQPDEKENFTWRRESQEE